MDQSKVHAALSDTFLREGEVLVRWGLTMEIAKPDGETYLGHRSGEGFDGSEEPMAWAMLGMMQARVRLLENVLLGMAKPAEDDE